MQPPDPGFKPNPFLGLIRSRKFWLAMLDLILGVVTYFVVKYAPAAADDVKFVFAAVQPALLMVIGAIAYEDKARLEAASSDLSTLAYAKMAERDEKAVTSADTV